MFYKPILCLAGISSVKTVYLAPPTAGALPVNVRDAKALAFQTEPVTSMSR